MWWTVYRRRLIFFRARHGHEYQEARGRLSMCEAWVLHRKIAFGSQLLIYQITQNYPITKFSHGATLLLLQHEQELITSGITD